MEGLNGAPMQEGVEGNKNIMTVTGVGSFEFGNIEIHEAGVYEYDIYEVDNRVPGYTYDKTRYHLRFEISVIDGEFVEKKTITADGKQYNEMTFTFINKYKKPAESDTGVYTYIIPKTGIK